MNKRNAEVKIIIPTVKSHQIREGVFSFEKIVCDGAIQATAFACAYLNVFLPNIACVADKETANLRFVFDKDLKRGAYRLDINDEIVVTYNDEQGIRNAMATLLQLVEVVPSGYFAQHQTIDDFPDCNFRSVLIDLARGLPDFERLKEDIRRLSLVKCSYIHLHLMDTMGVCYESDVLKMTEGIRGTKLYSKDALKSLVSYCQGLGIELIPEFEIPAHAHYLTMHNSSLACKTTEENPSPAVVCAGSEETYRFYANLIAELAEIFPSPYLHMGGDELYFNDFPHWNWQPNWEKCEICKAVMAQNQINGVEELYYYVVRRIYDIAKSHGKTLVLFNDQLNVAKPLDLPKDIVVQFWRVSDKNRGPRTGCSYRRFLEQGFQVICGVSDYCYIDIEEYANPEKTAWFDFNTYDNSAEYKDLVLGGEASAWEYGNPEYTHYAFSFTSSAGLLLAKMWNGQNVVYDKAYRVAFSRLILGHDTPKDYDIFELFGSIMPPRLNDRVSYASLENALLDDELLEKHTTALEAVSCTYSKIYLQGLKDLLKNFYKKEE